MPILEQLQTEVKHHRYASNLLVFLLVAWFYFFKYIVFLAILVFLAVTLKRRERVIKINQESQEHIMGWKCFAEEQSLVYGPFGIKVEIIENIAPVDKKKKLVIGGLRFSPETSTNASFVEASICVAQPQTVVQDLETLCQLYRSGALTSAEFSQAKSLFLNTSNSDTFVAVAQIVNEEVALECSDGSSREEGHSEKTNLVKIV